MKKIRLPLAAAILLVAASASLLSCKDDDDKVEIIQPLAGDYVGGDACADPSYDQSEYVVRITNTADNSQVFVENYGNINQLITGNEGANNPHEKFVVTLQNGEFTLAPSDTLRTLRLYESSDEANDAATASATANTPLDLRTLFTYRLTASGRIDGDTLRMDYEISNSKSVRYMLSHKKLTDPSMPEDTVVVDEDNSATNELDTKCSFKGSREFKAPIVQGG